MYTVFFIFLAVLFGSASIAFFSYAILKAFDQINSKKSESILNHYEKN